MSCCAVAQIAEASGPIGKFEQTTDLLVNATVIKFRVQMVICTFIYVNNISPPVNPNIIEM